MSLLVDASADQGNADEEPSPVSLPQNMRATLDRQIASIGESFDFPDPNERMDVETDLHVNKLQTLYQRLKTSSFTFKKIGDGLLMMGIRTGKRSLASKLMTPIGSD